MRRIAIVALASILAIGAVFVLRITDYNRRSRVIDDLLQSHIDANVPPDSLFGQFIRRDLAKYFQLSPDSDLTVQFDLLRRGPTQVGISYPKFYLSVRITRRRQLLKEGYARVAAVNREGFDVTDFIPRAAVLADSAVLAGIFPESVRAEIMTRIRGST